MTNGDASDRYQQEDGEYLPFSLSRLVSATNDKSYACGVNAGGKKR